MLMAGSHLSMAWVKYPVWCNNPFDQDSLYVVIDNIISKDLF